MNLAELVDKLRSVDEISILELLQLNSNDLVDAFVDRVEENEDLIRKELELYD